MASSELEDFFLKIIHSTIYLRNRSLNESRNFRAKHHVLLQNVNFEGGFYEIKSGKKIVIAGSSTASFSELTLQAGEGIRLTQETHFAEGSEVSMKIGRE